MEEGRNGKEILVEKEKGKVRSRRWKATERDSKGAGTAKEKRKMEEKGDQREIKKKCMLKPEQKNERIMNQGDLWRKRGNRGKSRSVNEKNKQWKHQEKKNESIVK